MREKISEIFSAKAILKFLAMGGVLTSVRVAPRRAPAFGFLLKNKNYMPWYNFNQSSARLYINRLEKRDLIKREKRNAKMFINLTEKGRAELLKYGIGGIKLKEEKRWDGKWRVVIFDIPESKKQARDALRKKFKNLGMLQLQKSAFVYPFTCKKEIDFVADFFGVGEDILYLEAQIEDVNEKLKNFFKVY